MQSQYILLVNVSKYHQTTVYCVFHIFSVINIVRLKRWYSRFTLYAICGNNTRRQSWFVLLQRKHARIHTGHTHRQHGLS